MSDFVTRIRDLLNDDAAAGLRIITRYDSAQLTVTPPAGTLRANGQDVQGEFGMPNGTTAVTVDSWSSQMSRFELEAEAVADAIGYPLIRFIGPDGERWTSSARLSHRQADATWRAARNVLEAAGVPFGDIQAATVADPSALLRWFPLSILGGWWHSHVVPAPKKAVDQAKARKIWARDQDTVDAFAGYARMRPDARSARLVTSEIIALNARRRSRMAAKVDDLFGAVTGKEGEQKGPSAVGLGSLPPVLESKAPVDVTFGAIEGRWFFSFAGLREFAFDDDVRDDARVLAVALAVLLHLKAQQRTRLRAGTELIVDVNSSRTEVLRHDGAAEPIELPPMSDLIDVVKRLGARVGWGGPVDISFTEDSILARLVRNLTKDGAAEDEA
ncbi:type I-U CRISPR-associated protein Cas7 [Calidifontibacter sp. DB0510]|uniref:Type I-U CRISPR-associated protein Cas7 n=1 Tax=Metallococcus carri TaxID=1656884 RepID=A0A967EHE4_9MICO|nr:type I-U CRISPR-associated RAMP protein Csb1/Cas7u [Metallococcus carri]NHN56238.1 type I-U CRISPR-associated protein Cas7 [Metallococcus carri]NOP38710.1 type I-U CRISPR-associated protein Cas7 [Calidifontibacter sp. DB2511S]